MKKDCFLVDLNCRDCIRRWFLLSPSGLADVNVDSTDMGPTVFMGRPYGWMHTSAYVYFAASQKLDDDDKFKCHQGPH